MDESSVMAHAFVSKYFDTFDSQDTRASLSSFYRPESMLRWDGNAAQGTQEIMEQLTKSGVKTMKTYVTNTDGAPSINGAILVCVTGKLLLDLSFDTPINFTETFLLAPIPGQPGGFYIYNQNFRLIEG